MITRVAAVKRVPSEAAISEVLWARHEAWLSWYCAGARTSPGLSPSDAAASAAAAAAAAAACFCLLRWRSLRRRFRSDVAACSVRSCWLGTCSRTPPSSDGLDALSRSGTGSAPACAAPIRATRCRLQSKVTARRAPVLRPLLLGGSSRLISPPRASSCLLSPPLGLLSAASLLHVCCLSATSRPPLSCLSAACLLPLGYLSAACLLPLCCMSAASRLPLGCMSAASLLHVCCLSAASLLHASSPVQRSVLRKVGSHFMMRIDGARADGLVGWEMPVHSGRCADTPLAARRPTAAAEVLPRM